MSESLDTLGYVTNITAAGLAYKAQLESAIAGLPADAVAVKAECEAALTATAASLAVIKESTQVLTEEHNMTQPTA